MSNVLYRRHVQSDFQTLGTAVISGVVRVLTAPASRPVYLFENDSLRLRRATRSAADGTYSFSHLATGMSWLVLAVDPDGAYNAVVADRVAT